MMAVKRMGKMISPAAISLFGLALLIYDPLHQNSLKNNPESKIKLSSTRVYAFYKKFPKDSIKISAFAFMATGVFLHTFDSSSTSFSTTWKTFCCFFLILSAGRMHLLSLELNAKFEQARDKWIKEENQLNNSSNNLPHHSFFV